MFCKSRESETVSEPQISIRWNYERLSHKDETKHVSQKSARCKDNTFERHALRPTHTVLCHAGKCYAALRNIRSDVIEDLLMRRFLASTVISLIRRKNGYLLYFRKKQQSCLLVARKKSCKLRYTTFRHAHAFSFEKKTQQITVLADTESVLRSLIIFEPRNVLICKVCQLLSHADGTILLSVGVNYCSLQQKPAAITYPQKNDAGLFHKTGFSCIKNLRKALLFDPRVFCFTPLHPFPKDITQNEKGFVM